MSTESSVRTTRSPQGIRHIYRWDLDKTYLDTDFRIHRIWKVPFESAADKRNIPGVVTLLKELSKGDSVGKARVTFISGSPRQMRARIEEKFRLDGLQPDSLTLKPNLQNFVSLRWRAIREQVGFKLPLLLEARAEETFEVNETCFGDDSESDAFIYSLYADLVAGKIGDFTLREMMNAAGAYPDAILRARDARRRVKIRDNVEKIYIHLAMGTPPERFVPYGPRVVPIKDYFQASLCLYQDAHLSAGGVVSVAYDMVVRYRYSFRRLAHSFKDIMRRGFFGHEAAERLAVEVEGMHFPAPLPSREQTVAMLRRVASEVPDEPRLPPTPNAIDYPHLIETLRHKVEQAEIEGTLPNPLERKVMEVELALQDEAHKLIEAHAQRQSSRK